MAQRLRHFSAPACQPKLSRSERKAAGVYYTPLEIVRLILDRTLGATSGGQPPRILDPACGAGEFLVEALLRLRARYGAMSAQAAIAGIDIDRAAASTARSRLKEIESSFPRASIHIADALADGSLAAASFDLVVGNPPYVNIRQLAKTHSREKINELRRRFRTARGNFDLYVLFIERAIELLRPGGRCALIVPNKWATLDYARPCRELLLAETTIEHVIDFSNARVFTGASVYPHVLVFRKQPAEARHAIEFRDFPTGAAQRIEQRALSPVAIHLASRLDVESRVATLPLGEVATLACGTAGYTAQRIARRLLDGSPEDTNAANFITSGNIDRYAIRLGNVRYLNRDYARPKLPLDIPELTSAKRRLFAEPKIVVAGMSRRLEAAWDERGLALGVQVFAASQFKADPFYLLALLNSKLLSHLFATRFDAKRLGGGYLAINKGQLAQLPIRTIAAAERQDCRRQIQLLELAVEPGPSQEAEIDQLVYQLYRLTDAEIARVESHFAEPRAAAA
jgi:SAM-dependent methyltransferase